ncbi:MAG: hypothetical protein CME70_01960 [Halobacteriovorax sp.]|nr:hypothetical protein [Halobacteriovorax sp.]|tara:strand:+ start:53852 stop:54535 length:684 start_codon:yes stop_codon:yes gene_type:complete
MIEVIGKSLETLITQPLRFVVFFILQCIILSFSPFLELQGIKAGSALYLSVDLLVALLTVWNFTYLLHIVLDLRENKNEGNIELMIQATYDAPTFFLYSLLYGLTIMAGALALIIPGLYFCLFHYFAPFASIIDPEVNEGEDSYLSYSRKLVKPKWLMVAGFFILLLILNGIVPAITMSPFFEHIRLTLEFSLIPVETLLVLIGDLIAVETYFFLKAYNKLGDDSSL